MQTTGSDVITRTPRQEATLSARLLGIAVAAMGLIVAASTVYMVIACWTPFPVNDQWDQLVSGRAITWSWLFSQHNEHRLAIARLIFMADRWLSHETNVVDLAVGLLMQAGLAGLLLFLGRAPGMRSLNWSLWVAGLVLAPLFWAEQWENFTWGFQVQFFGVVLGQAACFALVALGPPRLWAALAVATLELVTTYMLASGILAGFIALPLAMWLRRPKPYVAVLALAASVAIASYLSGYQTPTYHSDPLGAFSHLTGVLDYMAAEIGSPFGNAVRVALRRNGVAVARWAGWIGVAAFALLAADQVRRRPEPRPAALLAIGTFVVGMALLTGAGRLRFGIELALASRYGTPTLAFWCALGLLLAMRLAPGGQRLSLLARLVPVPGLLLIVATQRDFVWEAASASLRRASAVPTMLAGVDDPEILSRIYPGGTGLAPHLAALRAAHASLFAQPWADWLGSKLQAHVQVGDGSECRGGIDQADLLPGSVLPGMRLTGTVAAARSGAPFRLVLTDGAGTIIGYGVSGIPLNAAANPSAAASRWVGAARDASPADIRAYLLLRGDTEACPLGAGGR